MTNRITYYVLDDGDEDCTIPAPFDHHLAPTQDDAAECAEDWYKHHDGWEAEWPVTVVLLVEGTEHSRWVVEREEVPVFVARPEAAVKARRKCP